MFDMKKRRKNERNEEINRYEGGGERKWDEGTFSQEAFYNIFTPTLPST